MVYRYILILFEILNKEELRIIDLNILLGE